MFNIKEKELCKGETYMYTQTVYLEKRGEEESLLREHKA